MLTSSPAGFNNFVNEFLTHDTSLSGRQACVTHIGEQVSAEAVTIGNVTDAELETLLADIESDTAERTVSIQGH